MLGKIKDHDYLEEIAYNARMDLVEESKYSFERFVINFDEQMLELALSKKWEPVSKSPVLVHNGNDLKNLPKTSYSKFKDQIHFYRRFIWKHLPQWFKFFLSVTVLKKWVYFHLFR